MTRHQPLPTPALILAADHRARAVLTTENWAEFFGALAKALPSCDGILATAQPLSGLAEAGHLSSSHRTYLSVNRTGLAGSAFELDDRLVASVGRAAIDGWTGIKHMTRIDMANPVTAAALELLGPRARRVARSQAWRHWSSRWSGATAGSVATRTTSCWPPWWRTTSVRPSSRCRCLPSPPARRAGAPWPGSSPA